MSRLQIRSRDGEVEVWVEDPDMPSGLDGIPHLVRVQPEAVSIDIGPAHGEGTACLAFPLRDVRLQIDGDVQADQARDACAADLERPVATEPPAVSRTTTKRNTLAIDELRKAFDAVPEGAKVPDGVGAWLQPLINAVIEVLR